MYADALQTRDPLAAVADVFGMMSSEGRDPVTQMAVAATFGATYEAALSSFKGLRAVP